MQTTPTPRPQAPRPTAALPIATPQPQQSAVKPPGRNVAGQVHANAAPAQVPAPVPAAAAAHHQRQPLKSCEFVVTKVDGSVKNCYNIAVARVNLPLQQGVMDVCLACEKKLTRSMKRKERTPEEEQVRLDKRNEQQRARREKEKMMQQCRKSVIADAGFSSALSEIIAQKKPKRTDATIRP